MSNIALGLTKTDYVYTKKELYLTIILQTHVGYEVIDRRRGAKCQVGYFISCPTRWVE